MIALILLLGVTTVYGQNGHGHAPHNHSCIHNNQQQLKEAQVVSLILADMDKDGDGVAAAADIDNEFLTKYDHDGSGKISEPEFVKQWHQTYHDEKDFAGYLFHHFDKNDDDNLTKDDLIAIAQVIDTDGNGQISTTEFKVYLTKLYTECVPQSNG